MYKRSRGTIGSRVRVTIATGLVAGALTLGSCAGLDQAISAMSSGDFGAAAFTADLQMRTIFPIVFYGYGGDPEHGYEPSVGTVWEQTDGDTGDVYRYERALLRDNSDGTSWWYASTNAGGEVSEFEVRVTEEFEAVEMVWPDPETGEIRRHELDEPVKASEENVDESDEQVAPVRPEDFEDEELDEYDVNREQVNVTVGAGTFSAEYYRVEDEDNPNNVYEAWYSDDVPGRLIKQTVTDDGSQWSGELVEVETGYSTRFNAY